MDIKKLITGFLILAAIVSSSVFLLSNIVGTTTPGGQAINVGASPKNTVPKNVFVEPLPAENAAQTSGVAANQGADDGLPPISASSNLTDRLAENLTRSIVQANPSGPNQDSNGKLSASMPNLDAAIGKTFANNQNYEWEIRISDSDVKEIKNYSSADVENYLGGINAVLRGGLANSQLIGLVQSEDNSPETINAISTALEESDMSLRKLLVPAPFLGFHEKLLTLIAYQKKAVGISGSDDPLKEMLGMKNEENNFYLAVANLKTEIEQLRPLITKRASYNEDVFSLLGNVFGVKSAHAANPVSVPTQDIEAEIATASTASVSIWRKIADIAIQVVKNVMVNRMMSQTLNWIQGGGKPQFITNWKGFLKQQGKDAAGVAIQNLAPGLCRSFGPLIQLQLQRYYIAEPIITCTLDQVVQNVRNFYNDFRYGGWLGYGAMILPSGNYFGQLFESSQQIADEQLAKANAAQNNAQAGKGFISSSICVKPGLNPHDACIENVTAAADAQAAQDGTTPNYDFSSCVGLSTSPDTGAGCEETKDVTPGEAIASALDVSISAPLHQIVNSNEVTGLIAAIANSLINRVIQAGVNGLLGTTVNSVNGKESPPPGSEVDTHPTPVTSCGTPGTGNDVTAQTSATSTPPIAADLSNVTFVDATNVSGWNQTANLSSVTIDSSEGGQICLPYDKTNVWPAGNPFGNGTPAVGDPWIFVYRGGRWQASTFTWFQPGEICKPTSDVFFGGPEGSKTFGDFAPVPGETYGFMVSGLAIVPTANIRERSNVVMQEWTGPACVTSQ